MHFRPQSTFTQNAFRVSQRATARLSATHRPPQKPMYEEDVRHSRFSTEEAKWLFSAAFAPASRTQDVAVSIYYLCVVSES